MSARARAVLAGAVAGAGAVSVARPVLDALVGQVDGRLNRVQPGGNAVVSDRARALHATLRVADLHADSLLWGRDLNVWGDRGHADVPRLAAGGVALQVLSAAVKVPVRLRLEGNDGRSDAVLALALARRWPPATWRSLLARARHLAHRADTLAAASGGALRLVRTRDDLAAFLADRATNPALVAGLLSIEGAHALDGDPDNLDRLVDLGYRMLSPAHFFDTAFGGSAHGTGGGLTGPGRELVARMEARGVILDLAHCSTATIDDALAVSTRPVIASHTGVRGVADNVRNLPDAQLAGIAATGGLVGIGFWRTACGGDDAASIARSIAYTVDRIGADHVALGSDWDGAVAVPFDAAGVVALTDALLEVGLDEATIRAVMGENVLRFLAGALPAAG